MAWHYQHHKWFSPRLGREMEVHVHGHGGARVIAFPTSQAPAHEWQDWGDMLTPFAEHLRNGWFQFYLVETVDKESWYAEWKHPGARAWRQTEYDSYLEHELVPLTRSLNPNPFLITTGASWGAYHAVNFACRHPGLVDRVVAMSGLYDVKEMTDGYSDENVYFNNPADFMQYESDPGRLNAFRRTEFIIVTGRDDPKVGSSLHMCGTLQSKGLRCHLRLWDGWAHDWPWWRRMLPMYIGGAD